MRGRPSGWKTADGRLDARYDRGSTSWPGTARRASTPSTCWWRCAPGDGTGGVEGPPRAAGARRRIADSPATVGHGVLDPFLAKSLATADAWTGVRTAGRKATATLGSARSTDPSLMTDGKDGTAWASDAPPQRDGTFGVDLGATRTVHSLRVAMGADQPGPERDDYLREAVLEYSAGDERGWRTAATVKDDRTVTARLPEGTRARYVRLRATAPQENAVSVREFTVTTEDDGASGAYAADRGPGGLRRRRHDHRPRARRRADPGVRLGPPAGGADRAHRHRARGGRVGGGAGARPGLAPARSAGRRRPNCPRGACGPRRSGSPRRRGPTRRSCTRSRPGTRTGPRPG